MKDRECVTLLEWMLPSLGLRWEGFRRVRGQVCKRLARRMAELGLGSADEYRRYLAAHREEWRVADGLCTVTISRFCRDRAVFAFLADTVLPRLGTVALEAGRASLRAWSAGCGSGEEPYSLALLWRFEVAERLPGSSLRILGTDMDGRLLERARESTYPGGCLKELPRDWLLAAFERTDGAFRLKEGYGRPVSFREHDVRDGAPNGPFDLILCRNLAFTYFDRDGQLDVAGRLRDALVDSGALVLGRGETLPKEAAGLTCWSAEHGVYRNVAACPAGTGSSPRGGALRGAS